MKRFRSTPPRILALFCGAFSAGVFLAQYALPNSALLYVSFAALLTACLRLVVPGDAGRRILLIGAGLSLAFGYDWLYTRQTVAALEPLYGAEQELVMTLCDYPDATAWGARVAVRVPGLPGYAVYYGKSDLLDLRPGVAVRDVVRLQDARHIHDTFLTTFTSRGVFTLAYGRGHASIESERDAHSPRWIPVRTGRVLRERIHSLFPADVAPVLAALLTGDRDGLSVAADADISEAGLSHILAVSGMHCGFLIALLSLLFGRRRRFLTASIGIPLLIFYALLTGAKPSVIRASIMLSLLLLAPLFRRYSDTPTALSAALFLILCKNPFAAASVSLQLSFASVAGLLWVTPKLYAFLVGSPPSETGLLFRVRQFVSASLSASVGALVLTAPLCALYFGLLSLIAPVSNLVCLWAVAAAFTTGLTVTALSFVLPPVAALSAWLPALLVRFLLFCAHAAAHIPGHAVYCANPFLKYWLLYAYLLFGVAALLKRKYALSALLACLTLCVVMYMGRDAYRSGLDALALDVGQGQSVALASHGRFALVDCGSSNGWKDAGQIAGAYLRTMGCRRLDALILTHYDSDHMNGVESLLARLPVKAIYAPDAPDDDKNHAVILKLADAYRVPVHIVRESLSEPFGVASLTLFPPVDDNPRDKNLGLAALASFAGNDLLITGDMDQKAERELLRRYDLPDLEAFIVGHHGSKHSTSEELLSMLTPEIACISVGDNSYGHPTPETLRRLAEHGCAIYRTDLDSCIHLAINPTRQASP